MSLIPAFEIGIWNAWIFMVLILVPYFLVPLNIVPKGREGGSNFFDKFNKTQKGAFFSLHILNLLTFIYSVFVPIKLGTVWFYVGLPVYVIGIIFYALVFAAFAKTPPEKLVTGGIYHYSRNPMQLSVFLVVLGIGIATASWVFMLLAVLFTLMPLTYLKAEEGHLLKFYGDAYRDYMNKTPRWIGIPRSG
jgi:protein-S-isoprenylcysteine O-methyltransferase Ste14